MREETSLLPATRASEALLMGLRLAEGVTLSQLAGRFGIDAQNLIDPHGCEMLERLGFVRTGFAERTWHIAGEWKDSLYYGLSRADWTARQRT